MARVKCIETYYDKLLKKEIKKDETFEVNPTRLEVLLKANKVVEVKESKKPTDSK